MPETPDKIFNLFDESFRPEEPDRYSLVMEVERKKFSFSLLDIEKNKFVGVGSFSLPFRGVVDSIDWIRHPFHKKKIIIANTRSTLIPAALFSKDEKQDYLDFNMEREKSDAICYDQLENLGIFNIFCIPGQLKNDLDSVFPNINVCHVSSVLMDSLYVNYKNLMGTGKIFLNVRHEEFDLLVFNGKQLNYFNSFSFKVPDDLAYYLIFVMEQMNLNPEETPIVLLGDTEKKSGIVDILFRYIRNIDFAGRNETFNYSYAFNDIPGHFYYTLFNSEQCGL
jgi:hypothetical protein